MIKMKVAIYGGGDHGKKIVVDATPWFEQATKGQMAALKKCYVEPSNGPCYVGGIVPDIFSWLYTHFQTPEMQTLYRATQKDRTLFYTYMVLIDGRDVKLWQQNKIAHQAVDDLLGGES